MHLRKNPKYPEKQAYYLKYREKYKKLSKKYYEEHREYYLEYRKKNNKKVKLKAMQIVSGKRIPECVNCGCKDIRLLEVNHKNLGGSKDKHRFGSGLQFYCYIINGQRSIEDLEILCKICNAYHYVNKKFGVKYKIEYLD